jgi:hypothetical protein
MSRTINRKKEDELIEGILKVLRASNKPMATQEIAEILTRPWHSIQTRCLMLQINNKLNGFRVGRINLWQIK